MTPFRYHAIEGNGTPVQGVIEAEDRKTALHLLGNAETTWITNHVAGCATCRSFLDKMPKDSLISLRSSLPR